MDHTQVIEEIEKKLMFSCNIMENEHCLDWLTRKLTEDEAHEQLFYPNVDKFKKIFNHHQFSFNLDKDYYVWRLQKGADKMYCISHSEGTFYEIFYNGGKKRFGNDEKIGESIIAFLDFVLGKLSTETH